MGRVALVAVGLALLFSCLVLEERPCTESYCSPYACDYDERCYTYCTSDSHCATDYYCAEAGYCLEDECRRDEDCPDGESCRPSGECD